MSVFGSGFGFGGGSGAGASNITGLGTINKIPKYTAANVIGDSQLSDNGTTVFVGATATSTRAIFEVKSTTQGSLFPRMTTVERDAIVVGATEDSLFIYNTTARDYQYYDHVALAWVSISSGATTLYGGDGTIGAGRVATLTDTLAFNDGQVTIKGAGATNATKAFSVTNSTPTEKFYVRDDGAVSSTDGYWIDGVKTIYAIGTSNYGIGFEALSGYGSGNNNIAYGYRALKGIGTGSDSNVAIGSSALSVVGNNNDNNTAIGTGALQSVFSASGGSNTALGFQAGFYQGELAILALNNLYLGSTSGALVQGGSGNCFIGAATGSSVLGASNYAIALGVSSQTTADNQMVIGSTLGYINDMYVGAGVSQTAITPTEFKMQITSITAGELDTASGYDYIIASSQGTGTGAGGDLIFKTAPIGGSGTAQNALVTMMTIAGSGNITMAGLADANLFTTDYATDMVGVGVAPTLAKLQVQGAGATSGTKAFSVTNSTPTEKFYVRDDGMVSAEDGYSIKGSKIISANADGSQKPTEGHIFIGYEAGLNNTAGNLQSNIGIGLSALGTITSGNNNIAIGQKAMDASFGGSYNVAIGRDALGLIGNKNDNVAIGGAAYNTSASYSGNVGVGRSTGLSISSGSYNTTIGYQTGNLTSTARNYSIAIGANARVTADNQAVIGGSIASYHINDMYLGNGVSQTAITPTEFKMQITSITAGQLDTASGYDYIIASSQGTGTGAGGDLIFKTAPVGTTSTTQNALVMAMQIIGEGRIGFGVAAPTAIAHLKAGTATASTAPLKFTTGTLNTSAETGAMEFASDFYYLTANSIRTAISTYGRTVVSTATYNALVTDRILGVTRTATGVCTINLASAALYPSGYELTIMDEGLNATAFNITIDGSAAQTINGALTKVLSIDGDSVTIYSNGVDAWFIK